MSVRFLRTLLLLASCVGLSVLWTFRNSRLELEQNLATLRPFLEDRFDSLREELPPYLFPYSLQFRDPQGALLSHTGPRGDLVPEFPEELPRTPFHLRQQGYFLYTVPLRPNQGKIEGYAVLIKPFSMSGQRFVLNTFALFILTGLTIQLTSRARRRMAREQRELLSEVEEFRTRQADLPIKLPLGNPFKPVADTLNQLTASRERQDRILTEQHHHQQVLLSNMSEGILVLDTHQRITGVNPVAARWLDLGNPLRAQGSLLVTLCRQPRLLNLIDDLAQTGTPKELYLRLERKNADDRVLKVRGAPLIDKDQTLGMLILLQDVTTLRRLETLRQDFVANVSHELRTPLTSIKGYAEIILDEQSKKKESRGYAERILKQSTRMINIIEDLLSLARIENPENTPTLQATELQPVLENAAHLCEEPAQLRGIQINVDCPEDLRAEIHPPLLEQAVHNLIHNAVKYTHPDTTIHVRGREQEDGVWVEVEDQGPGIPKSAQDRLFERFYRVDKARSRAIGGTGLGLSITKHIAIIHHGSIGVSSEPGSGATFWIRIPRLQEG